MDLGSILGKIGFDWRIALANLVNFLIIYLLLRKVVFKKIKNAITERQEKIRQGLAYGEEAEQLKKDAQASKEELLRDTRISCAEAIAEARSQAESIRISIIDDAKKEALTVITTARESFEKERLEKERVFKQEMMTLVAVAVRKITKDSITEQTDAMYSGDFIKEL